MTLFNRWSRYNSDEAQQAVAAYVELARGLSARKIITACDANYMLKNDMCLCNPDVQCGGGVAVFCGNNTFPPCPHNTVIIQYVESATAQAFSIISLIFSTFLLLAFCCYVGCHCRRGKRAHHLQHPFKAKQEDLPHSFFDKYLRRRWAKGNAT